MTLAAVGGEDISRSFLSLVEHGRSRISIDNLAIVAERLGLPISYFLEGDAATSGLVAEISLDRAAAALERRKPDEALRRLTDVAAPEEMRPRALWLQGRALAELGGGREAIPILEEALRLLAEDEDPHLLAHVEYSLGVALYGLDQYDESLAHFRHALQELDSLDDPALRGKITVAIGHVLYVEGDIEGAIEHYTRAQDFFGSLRDLNTQACVYSGLSMAYEHKGDLRGALRYSKLSLGIFEVEQNERQAARELNNIAVRYFELGEAENAIERVRQAATRAHLCHAFDIEALARSTLATVLMAQGEVEAASEEAAAAERLAPKDAFAVHADARLVLAKIAERGKKYAEADELYRSALDLLRQIGHQMAYADAALAYSLALEKRGELKAALEFARQAAEAKSIRAI